jgi:hypothetical protein
MIISEHLRKSNIAEYIIYMWQTEDMLRSMNFDVNVIQAKIIDLYDTDDKTKLEIREWYEGLIKMSELENTKQSGHLQVFKNLVNDLNELHLWLLSQPKEMAYRMKYLNATPFIKELAARMNDSIKNDIDICLHGLYGIMLLKMKNKEITVETSIAIEKFRDLIATLSLRYHDREQNPDCYFL